VRTALVCQLLLLVYHQFTTFFDLYPFNGARNYTPTERWAEMGSNAVLMGLAPLGFAFNIHALEVYGVFYYFVLFAVEIIIWWIPYAFTPRGFWRRVYNIALALATLSFEPGDTLNRWLAVHQRVHRGTLAVLPHRSGRIVPNLEHMLLHAWTLLTALATFTAVHAPS
jgi:hypothetical protein